MKTVIACFAVLLVACSSETSEPEGQGGGGKPAGCADITGNYKVDSSTVSDTCPPSGGGNAGDDTMSFTKTGENEFSFTFPGIQEGACPGVLDPASCRFTSQCKFFKVGTTETLITASADWTFSGNTFSGSSVATVFPPLVAKQCSATFKDTGTRL